jgi:ABC-2 type transport system permease protein
MKDIKATLITERIKLRRSRIFMITIIIFIIIPLMMGLMMFVAKNPEMSAKLGMVGTKATLFGRNDWSGFLGLLIQSIATIGYIGFGFVTSWIFGREFSDRTLKDILALPVSRSSIVISKFIIIFFWCALLTLILYSVGLFIGMIIDISGWSTQVFSQFTEKFFITSFLTFLLCTPVAFFASYGKGIIAPLGFLILTLVMAQFIGLVGLGPYFPWAIPGVYTAPAGTEGMQLVMSSYIILICTCVCGFFGTISWWRYADHH